MVKTITTLSLMLACLTFHQSITAQEQEEPKNFIVNGSFEQANVDKLKKLGKLPLAASWTTATSEKADLYSKNALYPEVGAPKNSMGTSNPKDGKNYAGISTFLVASKDGRMYLTSGLDGYLEKDKKYCLSYSISLADGARFATNNLGFHFSKKPIYDEDKGVILKEDVIYPQNNKVQSNSESWEDICVWFSATGFEKFVTIGNFTSSTRTVTQKVNIPNDFKGEPQNMGYYYIDDLRLVEIARQSDCVCKEEDELEGPRIIFSKKLVLDEKASPADRVKGSTVYFYSNEIDLVPAAIAELDQVASIMNASPALKVTVTGHMDNLEVDKGNEYDTFKDLSKLRAELVKQYLIDQGVDSSRVSTSSVRADEPATTMKTPLSMARNRRIEFSIR
jgi:outer membrane protein OmpA-like peptidoglycan-associated protein